MSQVLVAGLGLSFVVAILEFIWKARYSESDSDSSFDGDDRQGLCRYCSNSHFRLIYRIEKGGKKHVFLFE